MCFVGSRSPLVPLANLARIVRGFQRLGWRRLKAGWQSQPPGNARYLGQRHLSRRVISGDPLVVETSAPGFSRRYHAEVSAPGRLTSEIAERSFVDDSGRAPVSGLWIQWRSGQPIHVMIGRGKAQTQVGLIRPTDAALLAAEAERADHGQDPILVTIGWFSPAAPDDGLDLDIPTYTK